jgi:large subunit ribosomal protein L33
MAKKPSRQYVWLQCSETGDLNYRTEVSLQAGIPARLAEGIKKYCPKLRKRTVHKVKKK